ncbi:MAG: ABC transporter permease [Bacillota bacterium]
MRFYNIALKDIKFVMKSPYIIAPLLAVHFLQFIISINVYENFIGQTSGNNAYAVIEIINHGSNTNTVTFYASYILTQLMTLTSIIIATLMTAEWENKTYQRMLVSPANSFQINLGIYSGYMAVMIIISAMFMLLTSLTYGFDWGRAYFNIFVITLSLAFVCVAFSMLISNAFKETKLVAGISTFTVVAMNFLSGGIFAGAVFSKISRYTLSRWAFEAYIKMVEGRPLGSVLPNIFYIIITGLFFIFASALIARKGDSYE